MRKLAVGLLLIVGAQVWLIYGGVFWSNRAELVVGTALVVFCLIPPVNRFVAARLDRLRTASHRSIVISAIVICLLSIGCLYGLGYQIRRFHHRWHDEGSYLIQAQMLAQGRLWMPAHPAAASFETFHVFVEPVYASSYFPGTAILFVPGIWLGLPPWVTSLVAGAMIVGLLFYVLSNLIDPLAGGLGALVVASLPLLHELSVMTLSHLVVLLLALWMLACWLRWSHTRHLRWAALVGLFAGWAAITRPVDALAYAIPIGVAMAVEMFRGVAPRLTPLLVFLGAFPFLAMQFTFNYGVTGHLLHTPMGLYIEKYHPGTSFGLPAGDRSTVDVSRRPQTDLPQKQIYYDKFIKPMLEEHAGASLWVEALGAQTDATQELVSQRRLGSVFEYALPSKVLLLFWPLSVLGLVSLRRTVLWCVLPLYLLLYGFYAIYLVHYVAVVMPTIIFAVLLGKQVLETAWDRPAVRSLLVTLLTAVTIAVSVASVVESRRLIYIRRRATPSMDLDANLPEVIKSPALVFYTFGEGDAYHEEPVYNVDVAWPDDAVIVRAHDRGLDQNAKLVRHYAGIGQSDRHVYFIDRGGDLPQYIGTVGELVRRMDAPP
jgi:hypothetical protein